MLRFKKNNGIEFPDWEKQELNEIFIERNEKKRPDLPVLSVAQKVGTVLRDSSDRNIQYDQDNLSKYKVIKKHDFIIHLRSFEGGLECSNHNGISSPAYKILQPNTIIAETFKDYFRSYNFIEGKLACAVTGIRDGKNIDMPSFYDIQINVPSLEEQQKIADFLSSVDELITDYEVQVENMQNQKKGVMQKIFSQEVRFKADDGSEFPEWSIKEFRNICTMYSGGTPTSSNSEYYDGEIPFIRSGEIHQVITELTITEAGLKNSSAKMVEKGDILYALYGATSGEVDISKIKGAINQAILCIKPKSAFVSKYLVELLRFNKQRILCTFLQGGQGNLSAETIKSLKYELPCTQEQKKIADCLTAFDNAIEDLQKTVEHWKNIKKGLLQQLFDWEGVYDNDCDRGLL